MRTRFTIAVLVVVLVFYAVFIGAKGVAMAATGSPVGLALGAGVLVVPVVGVFLVWRELQFGRHAAELAAVLEAEGGLPVGHLPRRPSGRIDRKAADAAFASIRAEADPDDWRAWYRLGVAYEDAGDRTRARAAVRKAITLRASGGHPA